LLERNDLAAVTPFQWSEIMHKDQVEGAGKQARGAVKDAVGKATGDRKLQADGQLDKAEGRLQSEVGNAKETVRDALKK
jgi:uncharacterized protein YjbJ (UPF0337 family)